MSDRLAERLRATFLGELDEQVRAMNADLLALEAAPMDGERLKSLFRGAHTIKGAAQAAGVPLVEEVCHALETLLADARDGRVALGREQFALLFSAIDALQDAGRRLSRGSDLAGSTLAEVARMLEGSGPPAVSSSAFTAELAPPPRAALEEGPAVAAALPAGADDGPSAEGPLRVSAHKLDALLASCGQLIAAVEATAGRALDLEGLGESVSAWASEWRRASRRARLALERAGGLPSLAHSLSEADSRLQFLVREIGRLAAAATRDSRALSQVTVDLTDRARGLRMRPFAEACEALPRAVRDLAAANGKEARLELAGVDIEADRAVLDGLREAILHLVRNAVDHGIESHAARAQAGKPPVGVITVAASIRGDRLAVMVADDGAGLDLDAIRARLAQQGRPVPTEERDLARALFEDGFTTRSQATTVSGRGVGLDLVRAAVGRLGGSVDVTWRPGRGAAFVLEAPLTLATIHAVLVGQGTHVFAVSAAAVERLLRVEPGDIKHAEGRAVVTTTDAPVPLVTLERLLGPPIADRAISGPIPALMVRAGDRRIALAVDALIAAQDIVVRPLRGVPAPLVSGAAILGAGLPALVLNPAAVVAAGLERGGSPSIGAAAGALAAHTRQRVLVVDDSITTRTLEQSVLEAAGYDVLTAVDGADGWRVLQEHGADLLISDVEMPRMDGFALCTAVRSSKRFAALPVILVTALETPEHRARGLEVGADAYIGKSSFDQQRLLEIIQQLVGPGAK